MGKIVLRVLLGIIALVVLLVVGVLIFVQTSWDTPASNRIPAVSASTDAETIARGEYLFKYGLGCWGCHSSDLDPNSPPSGGRMFDLSTAGPGFGLYYAPNITPDIETGIGSWSDGEIVRALREGAGKDGRKFFPIMPVASLKGLSDDDVLALAAYMKSIPPVKNVVPPGEPSFVAKALFAFGIITAEKEITEPIMRPAKEVSPVWGKYVATNAGLCYDCHTPRNMDDGSFFNDSLFAGSSFPFGGDAEGEAVEVFPANLTMDTETGIGSWSEEEFLTAMKLGVRPDGRVLSPHMPYAMYASWDDVDARAAYAYLKSIPPIRRANVPRVVFPALGNATGTVRGEMLFKLSCQPCHGEKGSGTTFTNVTLAEVAGSLTDDELIAFIKEGNLGLRMPPFGKTYADQELTDIVAYVRTWQDTGESASAH